MWNQLRGAKNVELERNSRKVREVEIKTMNHII